MAKHNLVHGWKAPLPVTDDVNEIADMPFMDSIVMMDSPVVYNTLNQTTPDTTVVCLNTMIHSYRNINDHPGDTRVFHHLTKGKRDFLTGIGVTLGEVAYVEARYSGIMFVHTFRSGNALIPTGKQVRFDELVNIYRELKTIDHDHSVWAWALLMRQTSLHSSRAVDFMLATRELDIEFDDLAWRIEDFINLGYQRLLDMHSYDIDPALMGSLISKTSRKQKEYRR